MTLPLAQHHDVSDPLCGFHRIKTPGHFYAGHDRIVGKNDLSFYGADFLPGLGNRLLVNQIESRRVSPNVLDKSQPAAQVVFHRDWFHQPEREHAAPHRRTHYQNCIAQVLKLTQSVRECHKYKRGVRQLFAVPFEEQGCAIPRTNSGSTNSVGTHFAFHITISKIAAAISAATKINPINSIIGRVPFLARTHLGSRFWPLPIFYSAGGKSLDQARRNISDRFKSLFHTRPVLTVPGAGGSSVPPSLAHRPLHFIIAAAMNAMIDTSKNTASAQRIFISNSV